MEEKKLEEKVFSQQEVTQKITEVVDQMNKQFQNQIKDMNLMFTRLNFLFRVIEHKDSFTSEFVNNCSKEIEQSLTIEEPEQK